MLLRYQIIDLDDLRRAGKKASDYRGPKDVIRPLRPSGPPAAAGTKRAQAASEATRGWS